MKIKFSKKKIRTINPDLNLNFFLLLEKQAIGIGKYFNVLVEESAIKVQD